MTVDVLLHGSSTRVSSRISLPLTLGTETGSLNIHFQPPALSPLTIPSVDLTQPSPPPSPKSLSPPDVERGQTPSPIIFAQAPLPSAEPPSLQLDAAEEPSNNRCASSDHAPGTVVPSHATVSEGPPKCPASPTRVPASLEVGERMPKFHLPTRSPPNGLRPSLELSPDYVRARLEEDRATLAGYLENQPAPPRHSHRHRLSTLGTRKSPDIIGPLPSITYTDRALQGLPEADETDKHSTLKCGVDFLTEREVVSVDLSEPALKPIRQFYRSAPRPSIGRLPALDPAIWRMVIFQLVFFFILVLASLSTFIDWSGLGQPPHRLERNTSLSSWLLGVQLWSLAIFPVFAIHSCLGTAGLSAHSS
ncbi:hypothetical protein BJV74DRAFT_552643 [Russula compacta]|nr:hypothetical protein BJV74DRAFT_552643 [Russula compacta]